ncbi:hypothetical protein D9611_008365 [Ephemerocybe angulata]|uniref:MIR domain-containing protein n=1 Tax=Ephemerocybe angulata TaxID=980116 RepID=A0A8H5BKX3_9AGAR|nr:hypothetical protein D9611_008365 [Tulosesus angulatus]
MDNNNEGTSSPLGTTNSPLRYLKDGDTVRLSHVPTGRNLHSHTVTATVSKLNYEMSGYGNLTVEDNHDYWQVAIVDDTKREIPAGGMKLYKSPFLRDFWHLNDAIMTSNNALVPDPDKEDTLASKPGLSSISA